MDHDRLSSLFCCCPVHRAGPVIGSQRRCSVPERPVERAGIARHQPQVIRRHEKQPATVPYVAQDAGRRMEVRVARRVALVSRIHKRAHVALKHVRRRPGHMLVFYECVRQHQGPSTSSPLLTSLTFHMAQSRHTHRMQAGPHELLARIKVQCGDLVRMRQAVCGKRRQTLQRVVHRRRHPRATVAHGKQLTTQHQPRGAGILWWGSVWRAASLRQVGAGGRSQDGGPLRKNTVR